MNDDYFGQNYDDEPRKGRDHLFLWTVGILLLTGLALAVWLGSFYIFGHPEKPESYRMLQKLKKIAPPERFELTAAPAGEFLNAQKMYERYASMTRHQLQKENEGLLRDYINNYKSTKRLVPYLTGRYSIMSSYELKENDFFGSGVVAVGQSVDHPQTVIEHVYPAGAASVPILEKMLATGLDIQLERANDLAAVIHVERMFDGRLQFTVVPLLYGSYALKQGSGSFSLEPPAILNPAGGLPIIRGQLLQDCVKTYADHQRARTQPVATGGGTPAIPVARPAAQTTIVQVETPATPEPEPTPEAPTAIAVAEATPAPTPAPTPQPTPAAVAATTPPPPAPSPTPAAIAAATPPPPNPARSPILQPFLAAAPTPGSTPNANAAWRTYAPGRMPRGRLVNASEAADLAERGLSGERLYLRGNFVVTARRENRATLRTDSTLGNVIGTVTRQRGPRIIVEFPQGANPPPEQGALSRDEMRPFEIRDVRRGADGQVNIYVREVTTP